MSKTYHLAQLNIARMRAPLESPLMADFVDQLDQINALAESSPGYVWRLQTEDGDATSLRPFDDDHLLVNMSVWESIEDLKRYVYEGDHLRVLRDRPRWFEKMTTPSLVLWWIPAGHIPTLEEAIERLELLKREGPTAMAFTIAAPQPHPDHLNEPESKTEMLTS